MLDGIYPIFKRSGDNRNQAEPEIAICLLVDALEAKCVIETDSACFGRRDMPEILNEEDVALVD